MKILVSIDDTDTMKIEGVDAKSTGDLANTILSTIEAKGWGKCEAITRHQLLVHPDIPYTSHNSAMCFAAEIDASRLEELISFAGEFLEHEGAPDSDPGLCVAVVERISRPGWLISFGYMAKNIVLAKQDASELAKILGIHLSEHGGTGQGIIGALAAAGLRLSGNDGRFKGKLKIRTASDSATVGDILSWGGADQVKCLEDGKILDENERIRLGEALKTVLHYGKAILPVDPIASHTQGQPRWQTYSKQQMKDF